MAVFTVTSFSTLVGLLLAARKLATDPDILNRADALADLVADGKVLAATLREGGLSAIAAEMTKAAEETARHFTHPGAARDDALAVFWQVAPEAFADPSVFVGADLDAATATDRMVAAIIASPHARDFTATRLPEAFFRQVVQGILSVMLAKADFIAGITPDLWREILRRHGVQIELLKAVTEDTAEILHLVRELHRTKETTVPQDTLIAIARKISPRVADRAQALRELDNAADIAAEVQARGMTGSNVDDFVDGVLRRLAVLTAAGQIEEAALQADSAVEQAEAGLTHLLDAALNQHLLAFDAEGAARQIVHRLTLETPDPSRRVAALLEEQAAWHQRGRDRGFRLDLEVSIALARQGHTWSRDPDQRGAALNELGSALRTLGARESGTARLEEAIAACRSALGERTRDRVPLDWAATQNNLGTALWTLGGRESGTARLLEAVAAYRAALEERTRERVPLDWATTQNNLGTALQTLGARDSGTARLLEAVDAYRAALEERTRDRVPLDWAKTQNNLGNVLSTLGVRESGTARLEEAVAAYRAALTEHTRDGVPLDWATTQNNLGIALGTLGERESGTARLLEAVDAYRAALEERTRDRVPLDWAITQNNLGNVLSTLGVRESGTARLEEAVAAYRAALAERARDRVPLDWARATGNQGVAFNLLAERTSDAAMAQRALDQIRAAEAAMREGGHIPNADYYSSQIPAAEALVARLAVN